MQEWALTVARSWNQSPASLWPQASAAALGYCHCKLSTCSKACSTDGWCHSEFSVFLGKCQHKIRALHTSLQHSGSSSIDSILCQPHDPSPKELLLSHFCRPTSLEQPSLLSTELPVGFFPHKDNNHPNLSVPSVSPAIKQRQKCCFSSRDCAPEPAAWLAGDQKCLAF